MVRCLALYLMCASILHFTDVNYRKPPFNGSIFGKRNNGLVAGRVAGQDDRGVCEVLLDACGQLLQSVIDQQGV
ncbi:neuropeptide SIFamide-like [Varroa jacobsoni]|uniref:Uncharacterized protein n=1 Tax=Varroa destructor TaxID=109461 RepID=A0A7M7MA45_VARDE|nr:neuropeptide SIFamide-like [Varroa destructor]XP_022696362.1 neuropeptide SIFamide-like [Varroa jacobsoni]